MKRSSVQLCVVGVGAVGLEILRILKSRSFPISKLTVLARSHRFLELDDEEIEVHKISSEAFAGQQLVLFAGTEGEKGAAVTYAPGAIQQGAVCIDNGADFRMDPKVPLVVPEINSEDLQKHAGLIANPNCSTIQMVMALNPLRENNQIKRVVVSTYQAASGAGRQAIEELRSKSTNELNAIPQIGAFQELAYTSEEWKMVKETHKIFHDESIKINPTAVRIPVVNAHSESIYVELEKPVTPDQARTLWEKTDGMEVIDSNGSYPTPLEASEKDAVYVGRIRQDPFDPKGLTFWVVSDNLRKGAALNAVQIAERLLPTLA
jgi:aspartate-semialdehyde dehydrogenase